MKKRALFSLGVLVVCAFSGNTSAYSQKPSILTLAKNYSAALQKVRQQKGRQSLEPLLRKGKLVSNRLEELENLSEANYSSLEKKMAGFVVNREEILFVEPDADFYIKLAKTKGTQADIAFFNLLKTLKPDSVWPVYIEQETDVTGCTKYGSGILTRSYRRITVFRKSYPRAYSGLARAEADEIIGHFGDYQSPCTSRSDVLKEYRLFVRSFPNDENTPAIKKRLKILEQNKDKALGIPVNSKRI